jgi:hypothetical protein
MLKLPANPAGKEPPKRLPISPPGENWKGKDGRAWRVQVLKVLRTLKGRTVILDENHSSWYRAPQGLSSEALARLTDFRVDADGVLDAAAEWTAFGVGKWEGGGYLGISPLVLFDPTTGAGSDLGEVVDIHSVALVNDPNLPIPALNASLIMTTPAQTDPVVASAPEPAVEIAPVIDVTAQINACLAPVIEGFKGLQGALTALVEKLATPAPVLAPAMNAAQLHEQAQQAQLKSLQALGKVGPSAEAAAIFVRATRTPEDLAATVAEYAKLPSLVNQPVVGAANSAVSPPSAGKFSPDEIRTAKILGKKVEDLYPERA